MFTSYFYNISVDRYMTIIIIKQLDASVNRKHKNVFPLPCHSLSINFNRPRNKLGWTYISFCSSNFFPEIFDVNHGFCVELFIFFILILRSL